MVAMVFLPIYSDTKNDHEARASLFRRRLFEKVLTKLELFEDSDQH